MVPVAQSGALLNPWVSRSEHARELVADHPAAASLLRFYAEVLTFQGRVARTLSQVADTSIPVCDQIDVAPALAALPDLLATVQARAPRQLAEAAANLLQQPQSVWRELLAADVRTPSAGEFFVRACLQPIAEYLQVQFPPSTDQSARQCPVCGSLPQLVILRPEGEGARRSLLCSFCLREWAFRRVLCPYCGELDKEKLPYYTADECKHVRVEACDTCRRYLKSIDLSLDGLAVPLVDELALSALDVWAAEHDYRKITLNLLGL